MSFFGTLKGLFNGTDPKYVKVDNSGSIFTVNQSIESLYNNTTTPLSAGQSWSGSAELNTYRDVMVVCKTDASGSLYMDFSPDGINWDSSLTAILTSGSSEFHIAEKGPRYYRTRITANENQSFLRLYTYYGEFRQGNLPLNATMSADADATVVRAVLMGQDEAGNFRNTGVDAEGHIKVHIDEPLTAFGELKVAESTPIFQILHPYGINLDLIKTGSFNGASITHDPSTVQVLASVTASNSSASFESVKLAKYRNGQGLSIRFTCVYTAGVTGSTQYAGWGDKTGGFFYGYSGSEFGILRRVSGSTDVFYPQSEWNIDVFDGSNSRSNPSGRNLVPTYGNVYDIQIQWLGYGGIRFGIESENTGQFEPAHLIKYANTSTRPTVLNPTYPIRFEVVNTTNTSSLSIKSPSMASFIEGKREFTGAVYTRTGATGATSGKNMITLSNPLTFNGVQNKTIARMRSVFISTDGTQPVTFTFVKNATLSSTSYGTVSTYTPIQYDISGSYTASSGRNVFTTGLTKLANETVNLIEYDIFLNPGETLTVAADGSNTGAVVGLSWIDDV